MKIEVIPLIAFIIPIIFILLLDLGLFSKSHHVVSYKESIIRTTVWVVFSLLFYLFLFNAADHIHGIRTVGDIQDRIVQYKHPFTVDGLSWDAAVRTYNRNISLQYITGYIIEYSLSMDNVFVILLIFFSFNVPGKYFKRVLFWGILGAIVMRFFFIFILSALISKFEWILYLFGMLLVVTAVRMALDFLKKKEKKIDTEHHPVVRITRKIFPVHPRFEEHKFWLRKNGKFFITPLFLVLIVIEFSDVIFAVDSVPAIFAVTRDPYIVFFSNIFAILGLRSLFFLVSHLFTKFRFLKAGLSLLLFFIGAKMLIHPFFVIPTPSSLIVILGILVSSIILSLVIPAKGKETVA
jgi:tellurite resistance protein TerC